ncbi:hypothetical protein B0H34DRAFT_805262 [Crassisporium funariophilum]|nr:hypothetical protein B0H34DRAFT_805262 [Crassisporium funariophilum]
MWTRKVLDIGKLADRFGHELSITCSQWTKAAENMYNFQKRKRDELYDAWKHIELEYRKEHRSSYDVFALEEYVAGPLQLDGGEYYKEHPNKDDPSSDAHAPNGKVKVYCIACWHSHVAQIKLDRAAADSIGQLSMLPREDEAITNYLWGKQAGRLGSRSYGSRCQSQFEIPYPASASGATGPRILQLSTPTPLSSAIPAGKPHTQYLITSLTCNEPI